MSEASGGGIGDNSTLSTVRVEVRLFNSIARHGGAEGAFRRLELGAGATVGDVVERLKLPVRDIFLVLRNGRDVTPGLYQGGVINREAALEDGDRLAFSGPIPYSFGYGAPVV